MADNKPLEISDQVLEFIGKKRYYVFFADGSWRTCEEGQWKEEQVWKLNPISTFWFQLDEFGVRAIKAVIDRFEGCDAG